MDGIVQWLGANESAISAVVGLIALIGLVANFLVQFSRRLRKTATSSPRVDSSGSVVGEPGRVISRSTGSTGETVLAVMPITDASYDERDDDWAFELREDMKALLARSSLFRVIFLDRPQTPEELHADGTHYALHIGVRPQGEQVRINTQLVDVRTSQHIWSAVYTRPLAAAVEDSDEVAHIMSTQLVVPIVESEVRHTLARDIKDLDSAALTRLAYHAFLFGGHDAQSFIETRKLANWALEANPRDARALATRAVTIATGVIFGFSEDPEGDRLLAFEDAAMAIKLAPMDAIALHARGWVSTYFRSFKEGAPFLAKAVAADPTNAHIRADYGFMLLGCGDLEGATEKVEEAFKLSPQDPRQYIWSYFRASIARAKGDYDEALAHLDHTIAFAPYPPAYLSKILIYLIREDNQLAKETMIELANRFHPHYSKQKFVENFTRLARTDELTSKMHVIAAEWPTDLAC
ncbi:MAG: hypothetical protein V7700_15925 [Halioglobus sp.]